MVAHALLRNRAAFSASLTVQLTAQAPWPDVAGEGPTRPPPHGTDGFAALGQGLPK
jgi:hypothetical protein